MQSIYPLKEFILVYVIGIDGTPRMPQPLSLITLRIKDDYPPYIHELKASRFYGDYNKSAQGEPMPWR